jgi:hypothetical protein
LKTGHGGPDGGVAKSPRSPVLVVASARRMALGGATAAGARLMPAALHVLRLPAPPPDAANWTEFWLLSDPDGEFSLGDLVHFEDQLTGAGECEGLRWVLPGEVAGKWRLVPGDVESPVFPADRETLATGRGQQDATLRQLYEPALEKLMELQHQSLADVFGGDTEEYWANPDCSFRYPGHQRDAAMWAIDLGSCTLVSTHSF